MTVRPRVSSKTYEKVMKSAKGSESFEEVIMRKFGLGTSGPYEFIKKKD